MTDKAHSSAGATVSVIVPAYNSEPFLVDAIQSIYRQTVEPFEVIVVNDGSTDGTEAELRRLERELPTSFRWISKRNGGSASARNLGVRVATGRFVAFLDHDDLWLPEKLSRQLAQFAADPGLALSFTGMLVVPYERAEDGSLRRSASPNSQSTPREALVQEYPDPIKDPTPSAGWNANPEALLESLVSHEVLIGSLSSVMLRRGVFDQLGEFSEELSVTDDYLMWLKMAAAGMRFAYVPEPLVEYRFHGRNLHSDRRKLWNDLASVFDEFLATNRLSRGVRRRIRLRRWGARWHLLAAIEELQSGSPARARHHIVRAALVHPPSIRPGWIRMLGIGPPPTAFPPRGDSGVGVTDGMATDE